MKSPILVATLVAFCVATSAANASATWTWSFDDEVVNLAVQREVFATITNEDSSDSDLWISAVDNLSFGYLGLLFEPGYVGVITPLGVPAISATLAPGQSTRAYAMNFHIDPQNAPTPGVRYEIWPTMFALSGSGCPSDEDGVCTWVNQSPSRALTLVYQPVSEASSLAYLAGGIAALWLGRSLRRRWKRGDCVEPSGAA